MGIGVCSDGGFTGRHIIGKRIADDVIKALIGIGKGLGAFGKGLCCPGKAVGSDAQKAGQKSCQQKEAQAP